MFWNWLFLHTWSKCGGKEFRPHFRDKNISLSYRYMLLIIQQQFVWKGMMCRLCSNSHRYGRHSVCIYMKILKHTVLFWLKKKVLCEKMCKWYHTLSENLMSLNVKVMNLIFHWIQYFVLFIYIRSELSRVQFNTYFSCIINWKQ